jgi:CRP-like cAMP-binding protein
MADFSPIQLIDALSAAARAECGWTPRHYRKGQCLLAMGEARDSLFVIEAGLVKLAYLAPDGDEWVKSFIVDHGLFGDFGADTASGSRFAATAVEACDCIELPLAWVRERVAAEPKLAGLVGAFLAWLGERKLAREQQLLCLSPEQRYRAFLAQSPALAARLPQGDIARYLRVTPVAFSRIKRRIA